MSKSHVSINQKASATILSTWMLASSFQWKGSEALSSRQDHCAGQREVSDVYVSNHPARNLTDTPGAETFRGWKIFAPLQHSLSNYFCAEFIFVFLTESQAYKIQLNSGICHKMKAQNTLISKCVRSTHHQPLETKLILFMVIFWKFYYRCTYNNKNRQWFLQQEQDFILQDIKKLFTKNVRETVLWDGRARHMKWIFYINSEYCCAIQSSEHCCKCG